MKDSIKSGELRCGNWVMIKEHFYTGRVTCIDTENGIVKTDVEEFYEPLTFDDIHPIPLTKEVLEKVKGCELISESPYRATWDVEYGGGRYITIVNHKSAKTWEVTFGNTIELQTPFLHTLQNVVYFNWGKELEITL